MLYQYNTKWDAVLEQAFMDDPFYASNSFTYKEYLSEVTAQWLMERENWCTFFTFTFRDEVSKEKAYREIKYFIRIANELKYGIHYSQKVHHSYFSYVCGLERQERGVFHFHMCIDRDIDFNWVHHFWNIRNGFAWIEKIENLPNSLRYTVKYAVKEGECLIYLK